MQSSKANVTNAQILDSTSKIIFDEPVLCAQFLRDYSNIPMLKNVRPEDIEDVSERFIHLFSEERNADTVKRVKLENQVPFFLVSLIEHKTYVDYNVGMQILRYMVYIWEDYEKEVNRLHEKDKSIKTKVQKDFRYPVILPIVYYEGKREWTASREFKERIWMQEEFAQYIPNFSYELIQLKNYSNETLLAHKDEISLIMMFNKLQDIEDIDEIRKIEPQDIEAIVSNTPEYLLEVVAKVIRAFLFKMNLPIEETEDVVGSVKERKMGYLFENMEKMDIQLERRLRKEAEEALAQAEERIRKAEENLEQKAEDLEQKAEDLEQKAEDLEQKAEDLEQKAEDLEQKAENLEKEKESLEQEKENLFQEMEIKQYQFMVRTCQNLGIAKEEAGNYIGTELHISENEATEIVQKYWKE